MWLNKALHTELIHRQDVRAFRLFTVLYGVLQRKMVDHLISVFKKIYVIIYYYDNYYYFLLYFPIKKALNSDTGNLQPSYNSCWHCSENEHCLFNYSRIFKRCEMTSCTPNIIINRENPQDTWDNRVWWWRLTFWITQTRRKKKIFSVTAAKLKCLWAAHLVLIWCILLICSCSLSFIWSIQPQCWGLYILYCKFVLSRKKKKKIIKAQTATRFKIKLVKEISRSIFSDWYKSNNISKVEKFYNHCWMHYIIVTLTVFTTKV